MQNNCRSFCNLPLPIGRKNIGDSAGTQPLKTAKSMLAMGNMTHAKSQIDSFQKVK
jgi:hypothetical protein